MDMKTKKAINAMYGRASEKRDRAVKVSVSMPSRILELVDKAAEKYDLTRSSYIALLLREYLVDEPAEE